MSQNPTEPNQIFISLHIYLSIYLLVSFLSIYLSIYLSFPFLSCPAGWSYRRVPPTNEYLGYDTKQSDGEVPVILELWGMRSTSSLQSHSCPLRSGVVARVRVLSIGQIILNCLLMLNWIAWNRTVLTCKRRTHAKLNCLKSKCSCMVN